MRMFFAWLYVILTAIGIVIACITFVIGYFYLFLTSGFKKVKNMHKKIMIILKGLRYETSPPSINLRKES